MRHRDVLRPLPSLLAFLLLATAGEAARASSAFELRPPRPATTEETLTRHAAADAASARVWVFFTDKGIHDSVTCGTRLAALAAHLDVRVAARRGRTLVDVPVDFHDLPVDEDHVARITYLGAAVHHESRWLNAVSVSASPDALSRIAAEPMVAALVPVSRRDAPDGDAPRGGSRTVEGADVVTLGALDADAWIAAAEAAERDGADVVVSGRVRCVAPGTGSTADAVSAPVAFAIMVAQGRGLVMCPSSDLAADAARLLATHGHWTPADVQSALAAPASSERTSPRLAARSSRVRTRTRILYEVPARTSVVPTLEIFAPQGEMVRAYSLHALDHGVTWDGRDDHGRRVTPGVYLARLTSGTWQTTTSITIDPR